MHYFERLGLLGESCMSESGVLLNDEKTFSYIIKAPESGDYFAKWTVHV